MPTHASSSQLPARHASPGSSSSIKPTGWIRASSATSSASKPRPAVLSDRTNLPSASIRTPLSVSSKHAVAAHKASRLIQHTRTPATARATKQQTISRFFAPHTAPAAMAKPRHEDAVGSPSLDRPRAREGRAQRAASEMHASKVAGLDDDELEARAANLLRGRFGSVSRSLSASRSSTPTTAVSPPTPPQHHPPPAPSPPQPKARLHTEPKRPALPRAERSRTPPSRRVEADPPSSPFQPTLMAESLSNFTPPSWARGMERKLALFQRIAGVPPEVIREQERRQMRDELARAHRRMQGATPAALNTGARRRVAQPSERAASTSRTTIMRKQTRTEDEEGPEVLLRSPTTNRRIYALETQLGAPMKSALTLQPASRKQQDEVSAQQRWASAGADSSRTRDEVEVGEDATEDESETLPLAWPEAEEPRLHAQDADETQPLAWDGDDEAACAAGEHRLMEVPTSDDDDLLTEAVAAVEAPSATSSAGSSKRRRTDGTPTRATHARTASPVSLVSQARGAARFDSVVAALRKEERRHNVGAQLSLDGFVARPHRSASRDQPIEDLEDLQDVLSDDADETQPLEWDETRSRQGASMLHLASSQLTTASQVSLPSPETLARDADTQTRAFFDRL